MIGILEIISCEKALFDTWRHRDLNRDMSRADQTSLIESLSKSKIYQDYERAFGEMTGLPLAVVPPEHWNLLHHQKEHENAFCSLMARSQKSCAACLRAQQELEANIGEAHTVVCFAGLCETSVPVRAGDQLIGFLRTGEVLWEKPSHDGFAKVSRQLLDWGLNVDLKSAEEAYFHTRVLPRKKYEAMVRLLAIFADHLSIILNQAITHRKQSEAPTIRRAKDFIDAHQNEELSLNRVAGTVNMSSFYFCKVFKRETGLTFLEYLSRTRVEKAKNLLLNPNTRVSEVAFEVGFASLANFNRTFKRVVGNSPTAYRSGVLKPRNRRRAQPAVP